MFYVHTKDAGHLDNYIALYIFLSENLFLKVFVASFVHLRVGLQKCVFNLNIRASLPSLVYFFRLENVQYPYQLYIAPSTSSTERPSPNGPDRPFQCPTCGVRFTRIQNLKQHMLIHSGNVTFRVVVWGGGRHGGWQAGRQKHCALQSCLKYKRLCARPDIVPSAFNPTTQV